MTTPQPKRSLWPVAITAYFTLAIIFLATFIVWAVHQREDLVSERYYENEIRFQQQLDRMNRTQALSDAVTVTYDRAQDCISLALPVAAGPASGRVHLYRPADARLDRVLPLQLDASGRQQLDARSLADGLWQVRINWRANGEDFFVDRRVVVGEVPASRAARTPNTGTL
ncbi:MAG TPA: FixH family protein [Dongiaceae bacterium]|jgi:hypothetical protein|nr:FixH family protein [Dongiaceae bacterium]